VGVEVSVAAVDGTEWQPRCCARGLFFMVAIGEHGSLQTVPALDFDSLDESGRRVRRHKPARCCGWKFHMLKA